jgi:hypothetical protein
MTSPQRKRLYFPAWREAFAVHWTAAHGIASPRPGARASEYSVETWATAEAIAARHVRALSEQDLRHACNAIAIAAARRHAGRPADLDLRPASVSSSALSPLALDLVIAWFDLLRDPDDLTATVTWSNPGEAERRRYLRTLSRAPLAGYVSRIAADIYGTTDLDSLPTGTLRSLFQLVMSRQSRRAQQVQPRGSMVDVR